MQLPSKIKISFLHGVIQILVGSVFFLPLFSHSAFYFPFITPRNFVFRILVEVLIFLTILLVIFDKRFLPKKHPLLLLFAVFLGTLTVSSILGGDFQYSFWSNFERMDGLISMYHLFAFFLIVFSVLKTRQQWHLLIQTTLFAALLVNIVGVSQYVDADILLKSSGGERITSTLGNAIYVASYLSIHLFLAIYLLLQSRGKKDIIVFFYGFLLLDFIIVFFHFFLYQKFRFNLLGEFASSPLLWVPLLLLQALVDFLVFFDTEKINVSPSVFVKSFYLMLAGYLLFPIFFTGTRGAVVGLAMAFLFALVNLLMTRQTPSYIKIAGMLFFLLISGAAAGLFIYKDHSFVQETYFLKRIASISLSDATAETRLKTWKASWKGFLERPLLGWGVENFYRVFDKYFPRVIYRDEGSRVWFDRPHNVLIQYAVEGGIVAFALYLGIFGTLIFSALRHLKERYAGIILSSLLVAYFVGNLFVFDSINTSVLFYFVCAFMIFLFLERRKHTEPILSEERYKKFFAQNASLILFLSGLGVSALIWYWNFLPMTSNISFLKIFKDQDENPTEESVQETLKIIQKSPYLGKFEIANLYGERIFYYVQNDILPRYFLSKVVREMEEILKENIEEHPYDARMYLLLMYYYFNTASIDPEHYDKIIALKEKIVSLSPDRAPIYLLVGKSYLAKGEIEKGLNEIKHAVELAPSVFEPRVNLLEAYLTAGMTQEAEKQLMEIMKTHHLSVRQYQQIAKIYFQKQQYQRTEELLIQATGAFEKPEDVAVIYSLLADFYLKIGKYEEARQAALSAVDIDPSYTESVEKFLKILDEKKSQGE